MENEYSLLTTFQLRDKAIQYEVCEAIHMDTGKHVEIHKYSLQETTKLLVEKNISHIIRMGKVFRLFPYSRQLLQVFYETDSTILVWESSQIGTIESYCEVNILTEDQYAGLIFTALQLAHYLLSKGIYLKVLTGKDFLVTMDNGIPHFLYQAFHKCSPAEIPRRNLIDPFLQKMAQSVFIYNVGNFGRRLLSFTEMNNAIVDVDNTNVSTPIVQLVERMLHPNATQRPSFSEAFHFLWISYGSTLQHYDSSNSLVETLSHVKSTLLNVPSEPSRLGEHLIEQVSYLFQCTRLHVQQAVERDLFGKMYSAYVLLWIPWKWTPFFVTRTKSIQTSYGQRTPLVNSPISSHRPSPIDLRTASRHANVETQENYVLEYKKCLNALRLRRNVFQRSVTNISSTSMSSFPSLLTVERSATFTSFKHANSSDPTQYAVKSFTNSRAGDKNHPNSPIESPRHFPPPKPCPLPTYLKFSRSKTLFSPQSGRVEASQSKINEHMLNAIRLFTKKISSSENFMQRMPPPPNTRGSLRTEV